MILLYQAANAIEAHMIVNLLEQAGLQARIDGEYLQGGVGELPTMGFVKIMVEEQDYAQAKKMVDDWDAHQPSTPEPVANKKFPSFIAALTGFIIGALVMIMFYQTPVTQDGIDYNGDGYLDERWFYVNHRISRAEVDRNRDGNTDLIVHYDRRGVLKSATSDDNFDGVFESEWLYANGNLFLIKADTTGNGFKNLHSHFTHDVLEKIVFFDPVTQKIAKIHYVDMTLKTAEVDTDGDGVLDTRHYYNEVEDKIKTERIDR